MLTTVAYDVDGRCSPDGCWRLDIFPHQMHRKRVGPYGGGILIWWKGRITMIQIPLVRFKQQQYIAMPPQRRAALISVLFDMVLGVLQSNSSVELMSSCLFIVHCSLPCVAFGDI
eukprot:scaffold248547_cov81-Cyclotella_meneghiniana.AAC.2